jgi:hypothetical protein
MKSYYFFIAFACLALFSSCGDELADQLVGNWRGISWTVEGKEKSDPGKVQFVFNSDDTYQASYGGESEQGTYRVFGRNLYTTAEGKLEKLVKFDFDENLNLIFAMNRMGTAESIVLQKEVEQ